MRPGCISLAALAEIATATTADNSGQLIREFVDPLRSSPNPLGTLSDSRAHSGNVNATTARPNVHRNIMLAKVDRISRTIGTDAREPENQFTGWLAI
ncbi:PucR family transcriptional regulator [Mycobacterium simiae]|uniref:PucR family transcriptional regulator n=1 Tax=Mycobacterium simiae TaxID=1784 RepID=A0A5B1BP89_MYCSI|nr:PucR family transcriptional regulator [Mycobacterium simiae]KAA1250487.1 PucR family transcriptional regulator [Mycobacterium simiae]